MNTISKEGIAVGTATATYVEQAGGCERGRGGCIEGWEDGRRQEVEHRRGGLARVGVRAAAARRGAMVMMILMMMLTRWRVDKHEMSLLLLIELMVPL